MKKAIFNKINLLLVNGLDFDLAGTLIVFMTAIMLKMQIFVEVAARLV
jgi:hypothetical protein